jgi:uncharacterized protein GlcG (DUF336 family)
LPANATSARPHTVDASQRKAYTSASTKALTAAVRAMVQKNPGAKHLPMIDDVLVLGGGLPVGSSVPWGEVERPAAISTSNALAPRCRALK